MRRDLSGNAYQLTNNRTAIEAVAAKYRIPFWQAEMALATDPGLMQGIISDAIQRSQAGPGQLSPTATPAGAAPVVNAPAPPIGGTGCQPFRALQSPPGQDAIERIANALAPHGPLHGVRPRAKEPK